MDYLDTMFAVASLDLNIFIIFRIILIHLHALKQILFLGRILEKYSQCPILFTCNSVTDGDLQPSNFEDFYLYDC